MTLVALETLRPAFQPNVTLLRLRTDTGLVGLGEAFFASGAVEVYLHDHVATRPGPMRRQVRSGAAGRSRTSGAG